MIQSSTVLGVVVVVCVFPCTALERLDLCLARPQNAEPNVLPLSPARAHVSGGTTFKRVYTTVRWQGRQYQADEGIRVLMQAITDQATDPSLRAKALEALGSLRNQAITPQLISLYQDLREREEKAGIILCLAWSEDPRGLPLFVRVLDDEQDSVVRLFAAGGLAAWNVRRGVREVIRLLESRELFTGARTLANEALKTFQNFNRTNGWGYPEGDMLKLVQRRSDLDQDQKMSLLIEQIKKWFAENEDRFPDWKPGDPLPEVPGADAEPQEQK